MRLNLDIPLPPSVNHCYRNVVRTGRRVKDGKPYTRRERHLTAEADAWMEHAALTAAIARRRQGWVCQAKGVKVVVELWVRWPDARRHDMHNLHKLTADMLEGIVYEDDQFALLRDMDFTIVHTDPGVRLICWILEDAA